MLVLAVVLWITVSIFEALLAAQLDDTDDFNSVSLFSPLIIFFAIAIAITWLFPLYIKRDISKELTLQDIAYERLFLPG